MSLFSCIKSIIKRGKTTLPGNDSGVVQTVQVQYMNKVTVCDIVNPAGFAHNPLPGNLAILMNVGATEDNICAIVTDQFNRIKSLEPGETLIYNTANKSFVRIRNDGSIEINSPVVNINADTTNISGDLNVDGKTNLGSGGAAIARIGDTVMVGPDSGTITSGSSNNTAN